MTEIRDQFDAPVHHLQLGPFKLAYRDIRPESDTASGPTLLCVHGNPTWSYYYRSVAQRFGDSHRVVIVDHIGCGHSDKPTQSQYSYTLAEHQSDLAQLVEHLDLKNIALLAHDWGGAIGLGALLKERARFSAIMLLNTAAFPPPYIPLRIAACRIPILGSMGVRGLNLFAKAAVTMAMDRNRLSPTVAKNLLAPYDNWNNRVAIDAFVRDIPMSQKHPTYATLADLERSLPSLRDLPTLLVWGMKDWCFRPECLRRFQEVWPDANVVEIPDAGHYVIEDAPEETLEAIGDFLAKQFA